MLDELCKAVDAAKVRGNRSNIMNGGSCGLANFGSIFNQQSEATDPDYLPECKKLYEDFAAKRITREQFNQGCDMLDRVAEQIQRNRKGETITKKDPKMAAFRDE